MLGRYWKRLEEVLFTEAPADEKPTQLKEFEFNAIAVETDVSFVLYFICDSPNKRTTPIKRTDRQSKKI